jgi:hypothetical protein
VFFPNPHLMPTSPVFWPCSRLMRPAPTRATSARTRHRHAILTPTRDESPHQHRNDHDRRSSGLTSSSPTIPALERPGR